LLAEPLFPEHPRRRAESLEHIQGVPDRRHESFFERGYEDAIGDPVGAIRRSEVEQRDYVPSAPVSVLPQSS